MLIVMLVLGLAGGGGDVFPFTGTYIPNDELSVMPKGQHSPENFVFQITQEPHRLTLRQRWIVDGQRSGHSWSGPCDGHDHPDEPIGTLSCQYGPDRTLIIVGRHHDGGYGREVCRFTAPALSQFICDLTSYRSDNTILGQFKYAFDRKQPGQSSSP
jgi:hypothetical protein